MIGSTTLWKNTGPPPNPPASGLTGELLRELFLTLDQKGVVYAVLRNYEGLPDQPGRDIDIFTLNFAQFNRILDICAAKRGYTIRIFRKYDGLIKFHLIKKFKEEFHLIEMDVAWSILWKGIPLVHKPLLRDYRIKRGIFYTLRPGSEAAISLIKNLIYYGKVQEKYKPLLPDMARADRPGFLQALTKCLGPLLTTRLFECTCGGEWETIEGLTPYLRRCAIWRALWHNPPAQVIRWGIFIWNNFLKFFQPRGIFVVLIGPDGSGKSTVAGGLSDYLQPWFQGSRYFHGHFKILPRLRELAQMVGFRVPEVPSPLPQKSDQNTSMEPEFISGKILSLIYLIYYTFDFLLGYLVIFRARGNGQLIIFDRYYYDYLVQPGMFLSQELMLKVMRLIPEPDAVIYLKNKPEIILSRKPELTRKELERQGKACSQLITRLSRGFVVETTGTPAETIAQVANILIQRLIIVGK